MHVLLFQPDARVDHFVGVPDALTRRGATWQRFDDGTVPDHLVADASVLARMLS